MQKEALGNRESCERVHIIRNSQMKKQRSSKHSSTMIGSNKTQ